MLSGAVEVQFTLFTFTRQRQRYYYGALPLLLLLTVSFYRYMNHKFHSTSYQYQPVVNWDENKKGRITTLSLHFTPRCYHRFKCSLVLNSLIRENFGVRFGK
jgi:hypothetical protein